MTITEAVISAAFNASLKHFGGDLYVTIMTVATSINQIVFMPLSGFVQGAQPVIGYNYGAKEYGRVKECFRFLVKISLVYALVMWIFIMLFPGALICIFNTDKELIEAAVPMIRIFFATYFIMSFIINLNIQMIEGLN